MCSDKQPQYRHVEALPTYVRNAYTCAKHETTRAHEAKPPLLDHGGMTTLPAEYDFVEKPSEDFYCPITLELNREPFLTACCGNHLSQEAVTRLQGQPCPVCKERNLSTVPDKYFKRKVNEFKIRCPNKSLGCKWVGELGDLDRHLSQNSVEGECQFLTVACPYSCGDGFQRCQLKGHKVFDCPNRPFTCQYCGRVVTYITVANEHWPICMKYPVDCPNKSLGCQWAGERGDLDQHLNEGGEEGECQFVTVACPNNCGRCFQRFQLEVHETNDCPNRPFTCQYCDHEATYITVTGDHWLICTKYPVACPNKSLGCEWAGERGDLDQHLNEGGEEGECQFVTVACPNDCGRCFRRCQLWKHKAKDCLNRPFTCHYCSHKAIYIQVTNEHWPICEQYPLECPNKCGGNVIERRYLPKHLEDTCPLQMIKCEFSYAGCEVECQRQHMHTHLEKNVKLHLNKLSYRTKQQESQINALQLKTERQQQEMEEYKGQTDHKIQQQQQENDYRCKQQQSQIDSLTAALSQLASIPGPSTVIVMTDFKGRKGRNDDWYSPPFYSHIRGYKMCLSVLPNGLGNGRATHVSVFCHLERGEYDDQLKWPFHGDITIQLLNQSRDEGHRKKTVPYDRASDSNGRVVGKERGSGWGCHTFIAHTQLSTENKEYLKNDCLKFRILEIIVKSI